MTCLYTSTPSDDFIVDRYGPFVVCSACSGHGAKFAPLTGEIVADLACGGTGPFTPDRRFTLAAHGARAGENRADAVRPLACITGRLPGSGFT